MSRHEYLGADDKTLLSQCRLEAYRASGPGGQRRNKVSTAIRLKHEPTGVTVQSEDFRSQLDNKRRALRRLRMEIACGVREPFDVEGRIPAILGECVFTPRGGGAGKKRLQIGRKDRRFWSVAALLLDLLEACEGRMSKAADVLGITTSNLSGVLKSERRLLTSAQQIRDRFGQKHIR